MTFEEEIQAKLARASKLIEFIPPTTKSGRTDPLARVSKDKTSPNDFSSILLKYEHSFDIIRRDLTDSNLPFNDEEKPKGHPFEETRASRWDKDDWKSPWDSKPSREEDAWSGVGSFPKRGLFNEEPISSFSYNIEKDMRPKIRTDLTDEEVLRMLADRSLSPFRHLTTQDARVVESGLKVVSNPLYVASEADILQRQLSLKRDPKFRAEQRYDGHAAFKLAVMISDSAGFAGLRYLREEGYTGRSAQAELKLQVDKVNLCMFQVYETLRTGKVRDAYVTNVAEALTAREVDNSIENMLIRSNKFFGDRR